MGILRKILSGNHLPGRVAFVDDGLDNTVLGGKEIYQLMQMKSMDVSRYMPLVLTPGHSLRWSSPSTVYLEQVKNLGIPILRTPLPGSTPILSTLRDVMNIAILLKAEHINVLHIHTTQCAGCRKYALAASLARVPVRVRTEHGPVGKCSWITRLRVKICDIFFSKVIVVSEANRKEQISILGRNPSKLYLSYIGPEVEKIPLHQDIVEAKKRYGLNIHVPTIGVIGRLSRQKGFSYFIEAAADIIETYGPAQFLVVGDGELREQLEAQAAELGLSESFYFAGWQANPISFVEAMDIVAVPSLWEGFSLALLEFMAMAKPIVATRVDGNVEAIVDGESGLLVEAASSQELAQGLLTLLRDPDRAHSLGRAALQRVTTHFSLQRMVNDTMNLYDAIAKADR